jgi:peroxiredoxin Q/BCP
MSKKIRGESSGAGLNAAALSLLQEGAPAPVFSVPLDDGKRANLSDYAGQRLVIFFYPRAGTEGCTLEANDFTRLARDFVKARTALLGVSADPPKALQRFREKHALSMLLGSDEDLAMLKAYGVWAEKSMYGKSFMGILRTTVLIDERGRIVKIWRNVKVKGHAEAVLAAVNA